MIPNKNLFSGALGKSQEIGGFRCFSIPHTIDVKPDYYIDTDVPDAAKFVSCSLNGKLWLFQRSRRLYIVAIKFNDASERLEFATSTILSNEDFITRGIDWLLTNKSIITFSDSEPYINIVKLFNDDSALDVPDESVINYPYSFLPPIGDFQLIGNMLISRKQRERMILILNFFDGNINTIKSIESQKIMAVAHKGKLYGNVTSLGIEEINILPAVFNENAEVIQYGIFSNKYKLLPPVQLNITNHELHTFNGHTFAIILAEDITWYSANTACLRLGGHLATCTSKEKKDFLRTLLFSTSSSFLWLGGYYNSKGIGAWVTGEDWVEEANWEYINNIVEPRNKGLSLYIYADKLYFRDVYSENFTAGYICEWDKEWDENISLTTIAPAFLGEKLYGYNFSNIHNLCSVSTNTELFNYETGEKNSLSENGHIFFDSFSSSGILIDDNGANILRDTTTRYDCKALSSWIAPAGDVDAIDSDLVISSSDNLSLVTHTEQGFFREALHNKVLPISTPNDFSSRFSFGLHSNNNRKIIDVNQIKTSMNRIENITLEDTAIQFSPPVSSENPWKTVYSGDIHAERLMLMPDTGDLILFYYPHENHFSSVYIYSDGEYSDDELVYTIYYIDAQSLELKKEELKFNLAEFYPKNSLSINDYVYTTDVQLNTNGNSVSLTIDYVFKNNRTDYKEFHQVTTSAITLPNALQGSMDYEHELCLTNFIGHSANVHVQDSDALYFGFTHMPTNTLFFLKITSYFIGQYAKDCAIIGSFLVSHNENIKTMIHIFTFSSQIFMAKDQICIIKSEYNSDIFGFDYRSERSLSS